MWRQLTREPYRVALDLADADLAQALVEAIEAHPALVIASDKGLAHVVIVDRGEAHRQGTPSVGLASSLRSFNSRPRCYRRGTTHQ